MEDRSQSRLNQLVVNMLHAQRKPVMGKFVRFVLWVLGVDIPAEVTIGKGLRLGHPTAGLVIHPSVVIGDDVTIFHGVTLGRSDPWNPMPAGSNRHPGIVVGDGVVIAAGAVVLFATGHTVTIGEGAVVGANAVVTKSIPPGQTWVGQPARAIHAEPSMHEPSRGNGERR